MSTQQYADTFSAEWITIGCHRIQLSQRDGHPDFLLRRAAMIAAWHMDYSGTDGDIRIASVYYDNRHTSHLHFTFGSVVEGPNEDTAKEDALQAVRAVEHVFWGVGYSIELVFLPPGRRGSDSYDHTEYLTIGALNHLGPCVRIDL